ncbi:MAG TPA: alpha/beta fold hydrolase, partial [Myxococcales bacterium]|nr:alpha/beta fold hydrolase [Myxococcales bacterium]
KPEGCIAAVRGMAARSESHDVLARFAGPSLVVVGQKDAITPPARAQELAKLLQGSKLVEIPGAGHLANLEAPGPVNEAMVEFVGSLPAALFNG